MGLDPKMENNGSKKHKKSAGMGTSVNIPILNNILSLNIDSVSNFFNAVMVTSF